MGFVLDKEPEAEAEGVIVEVLASVDERAVLDAPSSNSGEEGGGDQFTATETAIGPRVREKDDGR